MASAKEDTVYIVDFAESPSETKISSIIQKIAPDIPIKALSTPSMYSGIPEDEMRNPEDVKIIVAPPWPIAKMLRASYPQLPNLQWVHTTATGVELIAGYFQETKTKPTYTITRSTALSGLVCEYVIGQILAHQRQFYKFYDQQKEKVWERRTGGTRLLANFTVVILGMGNIGKGTARLCKAFGMTVHGVTRSLVAPDQKSPHVDCYRTVSELDVALSEGDYIVSVLPSTPATRGLLNNDRLQACKGKKPVFINAGRGDLMSEDSIIKAVRSGWISQAVLDVFPEEPLPKDSPLWSEPGVIVTPHVASNLSEDISQALVNDVVENYRRFESGRPLLNEVDVLRGY